MNHQPGIGIGMNVQSGIDIGIAGTLILTKNIPIACMSASFLMSGESYQRFHLSLYILWEPGSKFPREYSVLVKRRPHFYQLSLLC